MSTYLKNMDGYKHNQLKIKSFDNIQKLFDKAMKRVNTFVDMDTELVKGSEVRAEGNETRAKEVVPDKKEVANDVIPLATKPPSIGDLKTMFDPHVEDQVWRNQQDYRVLDWKIYDSCGVHSLRMQHMHIHMLVEKRYPLTPATITDMLNKKLQCDHFSEMLSMKKLEILKKNIKFRGGLLGLKAFLKLLLLSWCISYYCLLRVNAVGTKLQLLKDYNCLKIKIA
ncbi:hypothetical protein Tco_0799337 [Tanacetum coccineum]|uniref:Uncharacterized protein n=1 Tax=Tanacetum coccineum TaxID=301880 RepID=A0ABQ4ZQ25_9ASTR